MSLMALIFHGNRQRAGEVFQGHNCLLLSCSLTSVPSLSLVRGSGQSPCLCARAGKYFTCPFFLCSSSFLMNLPLLTSTGNTELAADKACGDPAAGEAAAAYKDVYLRTSVGDHQICSLGGTPAEYVLTPALQPISGGKPISGWKGP